MTPPLDSHRPGSSQDVGEAGALTPYAVEARYPGHVEEITSSDVDEAIRIAENVFVWASQVVGR